MRPLIFGLFLLSFIAQGQKTNQEYLLDYKSAVQLYASHDFEGALQKLTPLTSVQYTNSLVPYTLYYFSLASLENNKAYQARATLRDLFQRFPNWDKTEEAYYLYGLANFKDKYFEEGITYFERITSGDYADDIEAIMNTYIPEIENIVLLKELNAKFPTMEIIAKTLVNRVQKRKYNTKSDLELSDILTDRFQLKNKTTVASNRKSGFVRSYDDKNIDFGVLLPFNVESFDIQEATTKNRFVYDMYAGMLLAMDKIKSEKIPVKLYGFDVGTSSESAEKYINDNNFKKLDVLIGPLYSRPNKVISEFAEKNKIFQIHPISGSQSLLSSFKNSFLVQASANVQVEKCLDFVESEGRKKTVSIYFEDSRDSVFADVYATEARKRGYQVTEFKSIGQNSSISKSPQMGHVFIIGNSYFGPKMLRLLGQSKSDGFVIATEGTFNLEMASRSTLNKNLYLINPKYVDSESESLKEFKLKYVQKMNMMPSYYSYLGYDMLLYYSRMLKDGKEIFRLNLDENPFMDDLLLSGFDYSNKSETNKIVPIVRYIDGRFEIVNKDEK
jgi:ABC-type branched-subunit amino acid transport system substrate-binding protein/outer membrane protein assembly factor BamD (BamD/ComL family)